MHDRLQFGMRENPASDRRHGSRSEFDAFSNGNLATEENRPLPEAVLTRHDSPLAADSSTKAAAPHAATVGKERRDARLMTVHEVAELLHVPSSWVYKRTRLRCHNRIPGIRLGKYWRFQRTDIMRWIDANRKKDYTRVG